MQGVSHQPTGAAFWPERALLCALVLQALEDAQRGEEDAITWLDDVGPLWADAIGAVDGERLRANWRAVSLDAIRGAQRTAGGGRGKPLTTAERSRAYYWRKQATRPM